MAQDIVIGGRLHSAATGNTVAGANEILDDAKGKKQNVINQEVDNKIGSDSAAGTIKGRIKNLETAVGIGDSVDERIAQTKAEIIGDAAADYNTLGKVEDKIQETKSEILGDVASDYNTLGKVEDKIQETKSEILGDVASDYNTLGKVEDKIQAETSRAKAAEGALDNAKANKATTLEEYGIIDAYTKNETYTKTEVNGLVDTPHQNYVTVLTYAALIAIDPGSTDTIYRVSNYDGSVPQVDVTKYSEYAWNGTQYVFLCVKSQIDEVFDISVYNNNATYADLAAALGTDGANVPQTLRRGGMSVKFVLSSDNKYVQYRLMNNTWSVNTADWSFCGNDVYVENPEFVRVVLDNDGKILEAIRVDGTKMLPAGVDIHEKINFEGNKATVIENPEFVYVKTDAEGKILWAIKTDGSIYYGAGVPQQVIDYINKKIAELSLDEYEDIVAFLDGLEEGDKTLQNLLDEKVDKEEGKSLIDAEYANGVRYIENPEFTEVKVDNEDRILEAIMKDGTKVIGGDIKVLGNMEVSGVSYKVIENPEYLAAWVDAEDKVILGTKVDGSHYAYNMHSETIDAKVDREEGKSLIDSEYASTKSTVDNPEFLSVTSDVEGKLLAGRALDGAAFENVGFSTPKLSIDGHSMKDIEDPEQRIEIKTDSDEKIISYRKDDGTLVENVGIETPAIKTKSLPLPKDAIEQVQAMIDNSIPKKRYLPDFGSINIKQETFYLDAGDWSSFADDVVLIQMYNDTSENAIKKLTLSSFYIKSTLTPAAGGGYDRTSVTNESVALELHAGKDVVAIDDKFFAKTLYIPLIYTPGTISGYSKVDATKVIDPVSGDVTGYEYNGQSTEVKQVKDVPPYKAWKVTKEIEHYCLADIDFGTFYNKNNVPVSIKYQGTGSLSQRKRNLRLTFYKKNDYKKKDKVKIGEMVRLSGYNLKSYFGDSTYLQDPIFNYVFMDMWESRGKKECYPWNKDSLPYNGATGMIKSFPIETSIGGQFFGLQFFGLKKDEKNYMLDGDHDASGIFVEGYANNLSMWHNASPETWIDDLEADDKVPAYPSMGEDSVSVDTAAAMNNMFDAVRSFIAGYSDFKDENDNVYPIRQTTWVDGTYYVTSSLEGGEVTPSSIALTGNTEVEDGVLEEYLDIASFVDYWIGLQSFMCADNEYHNLILYTGSDKKMFYPFFYDLDESLFILPYDTDFIDARANPEVVPSYYPVIDMSFWEKFIEYYKDLIINRYVELRQSALSISNIRNIYESYIKGIPVNIIEADKTKWGKTWADPRNFENIITYLEHRFNWLDNTQFNL